MAYIRKRKKSYSVVYRVNDADGTEHQKSEGYTTLKEAEKRKRRLSISSPWEHLLYQNVPE